MVVEGGMLTKASVGAIYNSQAYPCSTARTIDTQWSLNVLGHHQRLIHFHLIRLKKQREKERAFLLDTLL